MSRWRVSINGTDCDIQCLIENSGNVDWRINFDEELNHHVIIAKRFENLDTAREVYAVAKGLVDQVSLAGISRWAKFGKIETGGVYETHPDGSKSVSIMLSGGTLYFEDFDHEIGSIRERIDLLSEHQNIAIALRYIRDCADWNSYYKAFEAIGKTGLIVDRGIATKKECKRFTGSARARHHTVPSPIKDPMTEEHGRVWITNVVRRLVASLIDERRSTREPSNVEGT